MLYSNKANFKPIMNSNSYLLSIQKIFAYQNKLHNRQGFTELDNSPANNTGGTYMNEDTAKPLIRNFKDTLFRKLFSEPKNLLSLYNAMTGNHYTNPDLLTIVTLDNAIYMNIKNDLAFLINNSICMYEHQSTLSPNLPLRNLFYASREYEKLITTSTLYSSKRVMIPAPYFVVFYNGPRTDWTRRTEKLSDSFLPTQDTPGMELIVHHININLEANDEILKQCKPLCDYMRYIDKVRTYTLSMPIAQAVEKAIKECNQQGILADFLLQNRTEAIQMSIFEYDEEREMRLIRADEREIGHNEGLIEGMTKGISKGREEATRTNALEFINFDLKQNIAEDIILHKVTAIFGFSNETAKQLLNEVKLN